MHSISHPHRAHEDSWGRPEDHAIHRSLTPMEKQLSVYVNRVNVPFLLHDSSPRLTPGRPRLLLPSGVQVIAVLEILSRLFINTCPDHRHLLFSMRTDTGVLHVASYSYTVDANALNKKSSALQNNSVKKYYQVLRRATTSNFFVRISFWNWSLELYFSFEQVFRPSEVLTRPRMKSTLPASVVLVCTSISNYRAPCVLSTIKLPSCIISRASQLKQNSIFNVDLFYHWVFSSIFLQLLGSDQHF